LLLRSAEAKPSRALICVSKTHLSPSFFFIKLSSRCTGV